MNRNKNTTANLCNIAHLFYGLLSVGNIGTICKYWLLIIACYFGTIILYTYGNTGIRLSLICFSRDSEQPFGSSVDVVATKKNKCREVPSEVDSAMKVFTEHGDFIRSVIRFHVRGGVESDDLFQDFFVFLLSNPIPHNVQNVRGFLYRIVSLRAKDAFRRIDRYQQGVQRYAQRYRYPVDHRPENAVIEADEVEKMFNLINNRLPPNEALAINLRFRDNFEISKVAETMGIKSRSVSRYVSKGLKKIRHKVFRECKGGGYYSF